MNDKQHQEDTKYKQWADGMYVMLDDLDGDYELALVENSLRGSRYFNDSSHFKPLEFIVSIGEEDTIGVLGGDAGTFWHNEGEHTIKLTRAQALYIATGDTDI